MKVTIDELNSAYNEVNKLKINGYPIRTQVEVEVKRNLLTDSDYFTEDEDFSTSVKLAFHADPDVGPKGSYLLVSNVEVIDDDI